MGYCAVSEQGLIVGANLTAANLPAEMRGGVEFFDVDRYNGAASLQDNILFGKVATGQAQAVTQVGAMLHDVPAIPAMRASFVACFRNFVPMAIYAVLGTSRPLSVSSPLRKSR